MKEKNNIDISFCLPVYNVADFIEPCINSILSQQDGSFSFEILCINDGSNDNSLKVLENLKTQHSEIFVSSNKTNSGVSYTRNRLIEKAQGKYIWFVDPDDMLYPDVVSKMFHKIEDLNGNMILGDYIRANEDALFSTYLKEDKAFEVIPTNKIRFLPHDTDGMRMTAVWAGLFKRQFLIDNHLYFNEGMSVQEDNLFFTQLPLKTDFSIKYCGLCYIYRQRASSVMHHKTLEARIKYYRSIVVMNSVYKENLKKGEYKNINTVKARIHLTNESLILCLALVPDTKFVKSELKCLKEKKLYPYAFRKHALKTEDHLLRRILVFLLPIEPVFWVLHFSSKILHKK